MNQKILEAQSATETFYREMSAKQYGAIYADSTDDFKASASREGLALMKKVNEKAGSCGPATLALTGYHLGGEFVDLTYKRKCAKVGEITEQFSWKIARRS